MFKQELSDKHTFYEAKVKENEMNTLWKIKDCEQLLKSRVSEKFVQDALKSFEVKTTKQLKVIEEREISRQEKTYNELTQKIESTSSFVTEKFNTMREQLKFNETEISKKVEPTEIVGI